MTMMEGSPLSTDRRSFLKHATVGLGGIAVAPAVSIARPEGVNKPELLPSEQTNVIDTVKMLTKGQVGRLDKLLAKLEKDTGYKLRVLCQSYPNTPGLAIRDFWGVDEKTVVLVADEGTFGRNAARGPANLLNFNVGSGLDLALPARFWVRLQSEYGNKFFVEDVGKDQAVLTAVEAIAYCLRQGYCVDVPKELGGGKLGGF
ncbi:unnamed protein product [Heterosigma akashiwo]|eukprot:CAMPEP_0194578580 /NCGR_PEP_ID=MMETSP0292-20121207/12943_1 /TAXON_ID=39354 /ORGANISM="Heterosigma akashiwo, Strain CCMP2393" /LENGTH=201 /DNA_ID=CAMNT_0039431267 /DNA_START=147 /DNA_END=752 /DNA_ORIENTATION=-